MEAHTAESITGTVLKAISDTEDPRLRTIMESAIRHLHEFAREVNLTPEEWIKAIDYFTRVGQKCTPVRQEFILLSDTVGLSTLVNKLHDKTAIEDATPTSLLGPFFREDAPHFAMGSQIARSEGPEILLWGHVRNVEGKPLAGAKIMVWQTSSEGAYDLQEGDGSEMNYRGTFASDATGTYHVKTVRPLGYSIPMDGPVGELVRAQKRDGNRPAHIHFLISAPGYRELVTALYFRDQYIESDVVFGASGDLIAVERTDDRSAPVQGLPSVHFDFALARQGTADPSGGRVGADPSKVGAAAKAATAEQV